MSPPGTSATSPAHLRWSAFRTTADISPRAGLRFRRVPRVPPLSDPKRGTQVHDFKNVGKGRSLLLVFGLLSSSCLSGPSGKRNHIVLRDQLFRGGSPVMCWTRACAHERPSPRHLACPQGIQVRKPVKVVARAQI